MAPTSLLSHPAAAVVASGATDVFVYRRAHGNHFVLTAPAQAAVAEQVCVDDEPVFAAALRSGLRRVASEQPRLLCAGYVARAAAVVAPDRDVIVILGCRDSCLAGVSDLELLLAAEVAAAVPISGP